MDAGFLLLPELAPNPAPSRRRTAPRAVPSAEGSTVTVRRLVPRETLFRAGDPATTVLEVMQGAVMVSRTLADGRRQIVDVVGPGRLFGFAGGTRHDCTAVALADTTVCALDRDEIAGRPRLAQRLTQDALAEIERLRGLALALGRLSALERVAGFLAALVPDEAARSAEIVVPLTRAEIADHLGLTIETVSRNVTRLKRDGLFDEHRDGRITLPDCRTLRRIARGQPEAIAAE